jgi:hypothetical protein
VDAENNQKEMQLAVGQRIESIFLVERCRLQVDGVHLDCMRSNFVGRAGTTAQSVKYEILAP